MLLDKLGALRRRFGFRIRRWRSRLIGPENTEGIWNVHGHLSYVDYVELQKRKTADPTRRSKWLSEEWSPKVHEFETYFRSLFVEIGAHPSVLKLRAETSDSAISQPGDENEALAVGARTGQEVQALRNLGWAAIGVDLVPQLPLVIEGDLHELPFTDNTFNFTFSNVFDHALNPQKMIQEIERVTIDGGWICLHLAVGEPTDEFGVTEIASVTAGARLFRTSRIVYSGRMDRMLAMNAMILARKGPDSNWKPHH